MDAFELWCWRRLLRVPWTGRRSNQSILKEINLEYSFKGLLLNSNTLALSLLYGPTFTSVNDYWKNHSLTRWTFVSKVMSLLFNMLSRLVIVFLPRSKRLLVSWLQSPSAVILEPPKMMSATDSTVSPSISTELI